MSSDTTQEQPPAVFVRFMLDADASPGLLSRLLQPYAKRDLVPDRMWSHRAGETMHVEIAMEAMPAEVVHLVEGNLSQVVGVRSVSRVARSCLRQVA
jgi:acetolactate synthase regulatory subunit